MLRTSLSPGAANHPTAKPRPPTMKIATSAANHTGTATTPLRPLDAGSRTTRSTGSVRAGGAAGAGAAAVGSPGSVSSRFAAGAAGSGVVGAFSLTLSFEVVSSAISVPPTVADRVEGAMMTPPAERSLRAREDHASHPATVSAIAGGASEAVSSPETEVLARVGALLAEHDPTTTSEVEFLGAQYDAGLAWVHFEKGFGGLGLGPALQEVIDAALRDAGAPSGADRNPVGYGHGAGSVYTHGTDEQRRRWLRPLFTCEELWCQLFSEPGAGSDVAGLATIAVRDGDEWVVNGQKIWSSGAMHARWGILIARTDPTQPKHRGITFF